MKFNIKSCVALNNGVRMPMLGFGTFAAKGMDTYHSVLEALRSGYIHIDTAYIYGNEKEVGEAIRASRIPREKLFITTKLWRDDQGYESTLKAIQTSLNLLGLDYVDLYLIHWPVEDKLNDTWKAMSEIVRLGLSRAIGVSNFTIRLLDQLAEGTKLIPAVNQVEFTPFLYQKELLMYCQEHGIRLEAYSPLTRGRRFGDQRLIMIGEKHHKTPAQVLLRWDLQHGVITIPKTITTSRIHENADLFDFELDMDDMDLLDSMNENSRLVHPDFAPREW